MEHLSPSIRDGKPDFLLPPQRTVYVLSAPSKIARGLPSAVGWMAARNSSVVASVESVTNPLRGILGRLPPFAPSPSGSDDAAEAEEGAQPILLDIVIETISEARGPLSPTRRGEVLLPTPSLLSTFSIYLSLL